MKPETSLNALKLFSPRFLGPLAVAVIAAVTSLAPARAAQAPPHKISAANLRVVQNDIGNTVNSVTVDATLSINDLRVRPGSNRGDYNLQVGDTGANDLAEGLVMVAVSQNGRDNGELADEQKNYAAAAFDASAAGYWAVIQDATSARAEFNINCAVGFFRYSDWLAGWARNPTGVNGGTNSLFTGSPGMLLGNSTATSGYNLKQSGANGQFRVSLIDKGYNSSTNPGVLIVNHGKNEGNYANTVTNADGTWEIYIKDNFANAGSIEADPVAFVFIPKTNTSVVSGKFGLDATGTNAQILIYSGNTPAFSVTNFDIGRFRLTIPGGSPNAGVLIVSTEGGQPLNRDNLVSYEGDGDGWILEARDLGTFPPPLESSTNEAVASFVYIPASTAGIAVSPTNSILTAEFGLAASFAVQLDLSPTNDVTINLFSANLYEGLLSSNSLTFNSTNWNIPQIVTITGQDDAVPDGNVAFSVVFDPAISTDVAYSGTTTPALTVINVDNEQSGISVTPTSGLTTTEQGTNASFSVFLNRQPTADVVIAVSSSNAAEGLASTNSLTFTADNWNTPQTVTVTGVPDFRKDGDKAFTVVLAVATSADLTYGGINPPDVSVVNIDTDNPAIIWNHPAQLLVAEGGTTNYSVVLATQPDGNVTNTVVSVTPGVGTVSPAVLIFTPLNWNIPQVVTVSGVDNLAINGSVGFTINNTITSIDPLYRDFVGTRAVSAVRLDNEAQLLLPSGELLYGVGMPPIGIDGQARLEDVDATNYAGGTLTVAYLANGSTSDRLEIRSTGTNAGQVSVTGNVVSYGETNIGTFSGGRSLAPLVVTFNENATRLAVQQIIRSITFGTVTNGASLATRSFGMTLDDGFGGIAMASKSVRVGAIRLTQYQEGGDYGYGVFAGVGDIALSEVGSSIAWPAGRTPAPAEGLLVDWPDGGTPNESQVLLKFEEFIGTNYWQVPSGAVVVAGELLVRVNNTGDGGRLYRMLQPWDSTNSTWNSFGDGIQQDDLESRSVYESQFGVEDGSGATGTGVISIGVTPDVQAWVNCTTNFGWVMKGWPLRTDGTGLSPSEVATVEDRPRLRVVWLAPGFASASFQQGVADYTGTKDANLVVNTPDVSGSAALSIGVDAPDASGTNAVQSLLWFDGIIGTATNQIPPGSVIHAAFVELASVGPDAMGDGGRFHAMLQPWDDTTATWNAWVNGVHPDGVEALATPTAVAGNAGLDPDVQGTFNYFDVTSDLQAWADGTRNNYGWALLPWVGGANGWFSRSSESISLVDILKPEAERPKLRVYFTAPSGAVAAVLRPPVLSTGQVQVKFTGSGSMTYSILRAPAVTGPWTSVGTATVGGDGQATFTDATPLPEGGFYRVVHP